MSTLERSLLWTIRIGLFALLITPLILTRSLYFPFITGKNFFFRIITEIIFAAWVLLAFIRPEYRPQKSTILQFLLGFIVIIGIAAGVGVDPYNSFWSNFERMEGYVTILHLFAMFLVSAHTFRSVRDWKYFMFGSIAVSFIVAVIAVIEKYSGISFLSQESRPFSTLGNFIYLAVYLLVHIFMLSGLTLTAKQYSWRFFWGALLIFELFVFMLPASRGAFIGLLGGVGVMLLAIAFHSKKNIVRYGVFGLIVVGIICIAAVFLNSDSEFVQRNELLRRLTKISEIRNEARFKIWGVGFDGFKERPLLGWGMGNFTIPYAKHYDPTLYGNEPWFDRVHNVFLEWLVGAGLIGFAAFISMLSAAAYSIWQIHKRAIFSKPIILVIVGAYASYLIQNFFLFDTITTYLALFLFLAFLHSATLPDNRTEKAPSKNIYAVGAAVAIVVASLVFINVRQVVAARRTIDILLSFQENAAPSDIIKRVEAVERLHTFGTPEAVERYANTVIEVLATGNRNDNIRTLLTDATTRMEKLVDEHSVDVRYKIMLARLYQQGSIHNGLPLEKSEQLYFEIIKSSPNYIPTYLGLADLYLAHRQYDKSIRVMEDAYAKTQQSFKLFSPIVLTRLAAGQVDEAMSIIDSKISSGMIVGFTDREIDEWALAAVQTIEPNRRLEFLGFLKARALNQDDLGVMTYLVYAQTYADVGNRTSARENALRALEKDPSLKPRIDQFLQALGYPGS